MGEALSYRILLSERVKAMSIREAFNYIDAVQSYRGDWPLYLSPSPLLESERAYEVEGITPIPTTHGALAFVEFYAEEEDLAEQLAGKLGVSADALRDALERGTPLHRLVPPEALEELEGAGELIKASLFEVAVPLAERPLSLAVESFKWVTDFEVVEVEVPCVEPERVEAELKRSYYVGDYLRRLEQLFLQASACSRLLLLVRGEAEGRLTDLEVAMGELVSRVPALRATVMYYRLIPPL